VPYLIKDLGFLQTGEPATLGSSLFKDFVADHDTAYVTGCKKAGLVFIGRSSSPEFGLNPNTEPRLYGSCHNPWNLEYSPGGSSGGSAAAVAAGILPVAHATDGGGSIRIPAAQCGLFGLKPSRGRVSMAPDAGEGWGGLSTGHVVSRSVRDSALMLDCTAGPEPGDPYAAPMQEGSFLEAIARPPRKLRIALMLKDHRGAKLHTECLAAVQDAAKLCANLGHIVEEADPGLDMMALRPLNARIFGGQYRPLMQYALEGAGARAQPGRRRGGDLGGVPARDEGERRRVYRGDRRRARGGAQDGSVSDQVRRDSVNDNSWPAAKARLFRPKRRCSNLHRACDRISVGDAATQCDGHAGDERAVALDGGWPAGRRAFRRPLW